MVFELCGYSYMCCTSLVDRVRVLANLGCARVAGAAARGFSAQNLAHFPPFFSRSLPDSANRGRKKHSREPYFAALLLLGTPRGWLWQETDRVPKNSVDVNISK